MIVIVVLLFFGSIKQFSYIFVNLIPDGVLLYLG